MRVTWGLLDSGHCDAAKSMAIDEALLTWHSEGKMPPTILFYGWQKPTITVSQCQNVDSAIHFTGGEKHQYDCDSRLTGRTAVSHDDELTYRINVTENQPKIPSNIKKAYYIMSPRLLEGYRIL